MAWLPAPSGLVTPSALAPSARRQGAAPRRGLCWPVAGVLAAARGAWSAQRPLKVALKSRLEKRVLRESPFPDEKPYAGDLVRPFGWHWGWLLHPSHVYFFVVLLYLFLQYEMKT